MVNVYTPSRLHGIVGRLPRRSSFLRRMFFKKKILPTGERKIAFDQDSVNKGIALFCHPMSDGKPIRERGYVTREFEPAYLKPWVNFDAMRPLDRIIGEGFEGPITPALRREANLRRGYNDLLQIIDTRLEQQCFEGLVTGQQVISGDGIPQAITVSYGRSSSLTETLTSGDRWGEAGVSPYDDMIERHKMVAAINGVAPNRWVFGPSASALFLADPKVEKMVNQDYKRQTPGTAIDMHSLDSPEMGVLIGVLKAAGGSVELWEYQQQYVDESGAAQKIMGDYSVIIGYEHPEISQTECYGTIIDPELNYQHTELDSGTGLLTPVAPWHSFKQKPGIGEMIGVMCAPLMALTEKDASFGLTVR